MRTLLALVGLLAGPSAALALDWPGTELRVVPALGQETATARFVFRNGSSRPVRILSVVPDCDCLTAQPSPEICRPGAAGAVEVEVRLAGAVGHQVKTIAVTSDDAPMQVTTLTLSLDIPEAVVARPRFLFWKTGESPGEKHADIVVARPDLVSLGGVRCSNPLFTVRLVDAPDGSRRLLVKPAGTQAAADAAVEIDVTVAGRAEVYRIFLAIR